MLKIAGSAAATAEQMKAYIIDKNPDVAESVLDMIPFYLTEGKAEGIRGDVAFAQSCLETGNFSFKDSAVTLDQNNFCGMGVTANGMKGNSFATPQSGIRAQIQHLQAYATTGKLNQACVDPRYQYVSRGCAPYVEWLGIQENPEGKGWAAGAGYGEKIINILNKILKTGGKEVSLKINKNLISRNHTALKRKDGGIKYIVIHYVGALGDAKANTEYYKNNDVGASADFFVGHGGDIWQANDYENYYSWHCGGGRQGSGGGTYYKKCTNQNSIGIEMCVKKRSTATMNATDKDWYFTKDTVEAAAELTAYLMKELGIDLDHVIRHYDVNGKICPNPFVYDTGDTTWKEFKNKVKANYNKEEVCEVELPVLRRGDKNNYVKNVQRILRQKGYKKSNGELLTVDGTYGPNTVAAVKKFQTKAKLKKAEPGVMDAKTWDRLLRSY